MRLVRPTRKSCDRARLYASLELDDELSELERRLLATHLDECGPCRAFGADVRTFTTALRAARSEALPRPVAVTQLTRRLRRLRPAQASAAALVLAAVGLGGLLGSGSAPDRSRSAAPTSFGVAPPALRVSYAEEVLLSQRLLVFDAVGQWKLVPASGGAANRAL